MAETVLDFQQEANPKLLASDKWQDVLQGAKIVLNRVLSERANSEEKPEVLYGLSWKEAIALHKEYKALSYREDRSSALQKSISNLSKDQIGAIAHIEGLSGYLNVGAHVHAQRNQQNQRHDAEVFDRQARKNSIKENMKTLKQVYKPTQIAQIYKNMAVLMIITPHPTTDKKEQQEILFSELTEIAELKNAQERDNALEAWVQKSLSSEIIPHQKQTSKEETKAALDQQELYTSGMIDFLEDVQDAAADVLGQNVIDFTDPKFGTDLAERSWHNTDLDGKRVPAAVVLAQRIEGAARAVELYNNILNSNDIPEVDKEKLASVLSVFNEFEKKLVPLSDRLDDIRLLDSGSAEYRLAKKRFKAVFTTTSYKGQTYKVGPDLSQNIIEDMRDVLKNNDISPQTRDALRRVVIAYNQNGIGLGRQQFRHDSGDYFNNDAERANSGVIGNLFKFLDEHHPQVMKDLIPSGKSFGSLRPKNQAYIFKKLSESYQKEMPNWLLRSNQALWKQDNQDEAAWAGEILQHIILAAQCFNHNRMGEMIIANADSVSAVEQQFLAETFGIKSAKHINLNEEKRTVENTEQTNRLYEAYFGKKNLKENPNAGIIVKSSLSDTQKSFGMFIRPVQRNGEKDQIKLSLEFQRAVMDQKGGGLSYARGGLAPQMLPRHMLSIIEEIRQEEGVEFTDSQKETLKQVLSFVAATIQGRGPGLMMGTKGQVYDLLLNIQEQILASSMVIDGFVPAALVAPTPAHYSPSMKAILDRAEKACMEKYELMRTDQSLSRSNGSERLDLYMEEVSAISQAEVTNISKRGSARPGKTKKGVAGSRAIHSNKSFVLTGTFADGSYTFGKLLKDLHKAYQKKDISRQDLKEFWHKDVWRFKYMFSNAVSALSNANYEHGFDKISNRHKKKRWTIEDLVDVTKNNYRSLSKKENLAFHAVLAIDAVEATAYLEALAVTANDAATGGFKTVNPKHIINALYNDDDTLHSLKFGEKTKERFSEEIENGEQMSKDMRLIFAVQHVLQDSLDSAKMSVQDDRDLKISRQSALAHRLYGPFNMPKNLDRTDFGSSEQPVFDRIREWFNTSPELKQHLLQSNM